jgi:hypothetical protein
MGLRGRLKRLERDARKEMVEIPQRDGTVKMFPPSDLWEAFLYLVKVACGDSPTEEPEIFGALRNACEPAQKWMGSFYFDPAEVPARTEPVPDLSEPAYDEEPF